MTTPQDYLLTVLIIIALSLVCLIVYLSVGVWCDYMDKKKAGKS